jgi:hypothetical protein
MAQGEFVWRLGQGTGETTGAWGCWTCSPAPVSASPKGWCSPGGRTLVRQQGFDDEKAVELMVRCLMHT